jgi:hypothetical protein
MARRKIKQNAGQGFEQKSNPYRFAIEKVKEPFSFNTIVPSSTVFAVNCFPHVAGLQSIQQRVAELALL